jgi:2-iminobutanoate/2-iminopropanoate deaminase
MKMLSTDNAPAAIGPYSQAVLAGDFLFCSGQLGIDPSTGKLAGSDIRSQASQVMKNIQALLESQGLSPRAVVKTTIFLANLDDFQTVNEIYGAAFGGHKPARSTVQVARLPLGAQIEIEVIAEVKQ